MEIQRIKIADLKFAEYNPRIITDKEFKGLKNSLKTFGLVEPIVANKDMTIIGGHMRTRAWEELGNNEIDCYVLDLSKREERKLNVLLNSHKISGKYDQLKLDELLEEMKLDNNYLDLNLNELETPTFDEQNFADKNKGIELEQLGNESVVIFKYPHSEYLNILDLLANAKEKLGCDTNEEALSAMLQEYE